MKYKALFLEAYDFLIGAQQISGMHNDSDSARDKELKVLRYRIDVLEAKFSKALYENKIKIKQ